MFGKRTEPQRQQTEFLCEETAKLGYKVFGVGNWDLNYGLEFIREMAKTHGFTYLSANLRGEDGKLLFKPYTVVEVAGLKVGIISVIGQNYKITTMSAQKDDFQIDAPLDALNQHLPELRAKSDLVVLLSNANSRDTRQLLSTLTTPVEICIEGSDAKHYSNINRVDETLLLAANPQGKYLGRLDLKLTADGNIQDSELTIYELGKTAPENADYQTRVEAYEKSHKPAAATPAVAHVPSKGNGAEKFLGVHTCSKCHRDDWQAYQASAHARAWQSLVDKGQQNNPECITCHVVGFEYKNGYQTTAAGSGRNSLFNVQCEACHGYGTEHARDGQWAAQAKASCEVCHTDETDPDFNYERDWATIAH